MAERGAQELSERLGKVIKYCVTEFKITYAEVLGSLELQKAHVLADYWSQMGKSDDDDDAEADDDDDDEYHVEGEIVL
jgi:hypothetical protein